MYNVASVGKYDSVDNISRCAVLRVIDASARCNSSRQCSPKLVSCYVSNGKPCEDTHITSTY